MKEPSGALPRAPAGYFQGSPMVAPPAVEQYGEDWKRQSHRDWPLYAEGVAPIGLHRSSDAPVNDARMRPT
jgi:hypothetical protein